MHQAALAGHANHAAIRHDVVGLLPMAGIATRIGPLPFSKELYPIGFRPLANGQGLRPRPVCHYVLERMRRAGIGRAFLVLRNGKWDIPAYLGNGAALDMHLAYLMMQRPYGAPYTLDEAYPFVQDHLVALGFPDIIFEPDDAFAHVLARQAATAADVVLGLCPTAHPQHVDMVEHSDDGRVRRIAIKPAQTELQHTWMIAVWTPAFTQFMHHYLASLESAPRSSPAVDQRELFVGDVIQAAITAGMDVSSVLFPAGFCLDIGTPNNLIAAVQRFSKAEDAALE